MLKSCFYFSALFFWDVTLPVHHYCGDLIKCVGYVVCLWYCQALHLCPALLVCVLFLKYFVCSTPTPNHWDFVFFPHTRLLTCSKHWRCLLCMISQGRGNVLPYHTIAKDRLLKWHFFVWLKLNGNMNWLSPWKLLDSKLVTVVLVLLYTLVTKSRHCIDTEFSLFRSRFLSSTTFWELMSVPIH